MMDLMNYKTIGGACAAGFVAYCLYFDHKRRKAPDYRERVKERRERIKRAQQQDDIELPPENDREAIEKFFVKEIELGEESIQKGDIDMAVKHFSYGVIFCPQPQNLLKYMREALPTSAYTKLVENLPIANQRVKETYNKIVQDEDVE
uniref:Mitochondrial import receptor subunit TOM20 B n=1 Tax=Aceria tosichella TaxID=561515 RepID=A0A6G1SCW0_9ACAR